MTEKFVEGRTLIGLLSAEGASEANQACQRALGKQPDAKVRGFEGTAAYFLRIYAVKMSTAEAAGTAITGGAEMLSRLRAEGDAELVLFETHDAKDVCVMFTDLSIKRLVASFVVPNKSMAMG